MNAQGLLDKIEDILEMGSKIPLSGGRVAVDADAIKQCIEDIRYDLPAEIQNYEIIACRHDPGQNVQIRSRVLPQESNYLNEVPDCSYENILCKKKLLFGGETWEYEFYIQKDDGSEEILQHDRIRKSAASSNDGSRDSYLNEIGSFILEKDEEKTRRAMEQYLSAEETAAQLFTIA